MAILRRWRLLIPSVISMFIIFCVSTYYQKINGSFHEESKNKLKKSEAVAEGTWTFYPTGRLGNQMGEYATLYSLAKVSLWRRHTSISMAILRRWRLLIPIVISMFIIFCVSTYYQKINRSFHEESKNKLKKSEAVAEGAWTFYPTGRLGNQMGEYATLYSLAKVNGRPAYILPEMFNYLAPLFKIRLPQLYSSVFKSIPWRNFPIHNWMTDDYKSISGKYVYLRGTPNSWTFHHQFHDEILREFTFHDPIKNDAMKYLETLKGSRKNVTYIGVHVRRGDYLHIMVGPWKGVVADKAYLDKAMAYFRQKYQEPVFVVTSNGMQWCKENINNTRGDVYFAGDDNESSPGRDLAILSNCNHTIMTQGTFGTWAAYLAGGEVIYLTNYTMPDSFFLKGNTFDTLFLPEWIGISANLSSLITKKP